MNYKESTNGICFAFVKTNPFRLFGLTRDDVAEFNRYRKDWYFTETLNAIVSTRYLYRTMTPEYKESVEAQWRVISKINNVLAGLAPSYLPIDVGTRMLHSMGNEVVTAPSRERLERKFDGILNHCRRHTYMRGDCLNCLETTIISQNRFVQELIDQIAGDNNEKAD